MKKVDANGFRKFGMMDKLAYAAGILQYVGIKFVYNLDKATVEQMNKELSER